MIWGQPKDGFIEPCAACGRELSGRRWVVYVINGGADVLHPGDEKEYRPDGGEMGCHFVGPECRKKFGKFATSA